MMSQGKARANQPAAQDMWSAQSAVHASKTSTQRMTNVTNTLQTIELGASADLDVGESDTRRARYTPSPARAGV